MGEFNMSKAALLPIVSIICLAVATITGQNISDDTVDFIASVAATILLASASIWGVYKDFKKKEEEK
jgi:hypothetical protein